MVTDKAGSLFEALGGMHNMYINPTGEAALKKGGTYPNKIIFVDDVHEFTWWRPAKPLVTDPAKQCFECHQPKKGQDHGSDSRLTLILAGGA